MTIKELFDKYKLTNMDCWELIRNKKKMWIITHDACEKIASMENIELIDIQILNSERDFCRVIITMRKGEKIIKTVGEAELITGEVLTKKTKNGYDIYRGNCESNYIGCMAEKRGIDRAVLKLINAYEYGIYSDVESDDFSGKSDIYTIENNEAENKINELKTLINDIKDNVEKSDQDRYLNFLTTWNKTKAVKVSVIENEIKYYTDKYINSRIDNANDKLSEVIR